MALPVELLSPFVFIEPLKATFTIKYYVSRVGLKTVLAIVGVVVIV